MKYIIFLLIIIVTLCLIVVVNLREIIFPLQFNKIQFENLNPEKKHQGFFSFLKWKWKSKKSKWPDHIPLKATDFPPPIVEGNSIRISFVGHVTFLIQTQSLNILTDPIWSQRSSPFKNYGPKRVTDPGIKFENLPKIDLVIISHNHYDSMDIDTIRMLWERDKPKIIVPLENEHVLKNKIPGIKVETLAWHQGLKINSKVSVHLEPSQHWSRRTLTDRNKALWGTFVIKTPGGDICFIGDSGYDPNIFKTLGKNYNIFVSLIPIGAFEPRWFMQAMHMNPEESVLVHQDLKSHYSIGSHFNTFPLANDDYNQAVVELEKARKKYNIQESNFQAPVVGGVYWFNSQNIENIGSKPGF